jgi:hypothetical protein
MRLSQPLLIAAVVAFAAPAAAQSSDSSATQAYQAEFAKRCPAKHLEWLNPGILADPAADFFKSLTPDQKLVEQQTYVEDCAQVVAGASCGNAAIVKAAVRFNLTPQLATYVCKARYACTAPLECHKTRR